MLAGIICIKLDLEIDALKRRCGKLEEIVRYIKFQ